METSSAFDPHPFTDYTHFFNTFEQDESEFQHLVDFTFAEQLQIEEALKASLLTSQIPPDTMPASVEMAAESSLRFCQCCNERKENDQLNRTEKCGHFVCLDCSVLKMGKCPIRSCDPAPKSDSFKQFLPKDLVCLWENAPSTDPTPNLNSSNEFHAKMDSRSTKQIIPGRRDKGPKKVSSFVKEHAEKKRSTQAKIERGLAQWIEDNSKSKGNNFNPAARKWKGLKDEKRDHEIVWPPMVVISYTMHQRDGNTEWIGMTNQELLEMFSTYDGIAKAQSCYHVQGSLGMSILVFESSVMGYLEANRLHKHFADQGTDRKAWNSKPIHVLSSREKQLYGYLALKEDVDTFNRSTQGTRQLKYEMKSYRETVVNQIKQMCVENHQLAELRKKVDEHEKQAKEYGMLKVRPKLAKEESEYGMLKERLKLAKEESVIMRRRVSEMHQQHIEEVECQEQFYKEQIRNILESRNGDQENRVEFSNGLLYKK